MILFVTWKHKLFLADDDPKCFSQIACRCPILSFDMTFYSNSLAHKITYIFNELTTRCYGKQSFFLSLFLPHLVGTYEVF